MLSAALVLLTLVSSCGGSESEESEPAAVSVQTATSAPVTFTPDPSIFDCPSEQPRTIRARDPLPTSSPRQEVPSALENRRNEAFTPLVDPAGIRGGGPPPDGIPTIDAPCYQPAAQVTQLTDQAPLMAVEINGDSRAFPLGILTRHELVNDSIGGVPVTVSYCPLCNSGVVYDRRVDVPASALASESESESESESNQLTLDFGTSGLLYQSSLVMYDRQTQSLWTHFDGQAVVGALEGVQLDFYPTQITSWQQWRDANPAGVVLSPETGYYDPDSYNRNPYPGYETSERLLSPVFQSEDIDPRLPDKERVLGIEFAAADRTGETAAVAVRHEELRRQQVLMFETGATDGMGSPKQLVAFNIPGTSSALDTSELDAGLDLGSSAVFLAAAGGLQLTFRPSDDSGQAVTFTDEQTGSTWNIFGEAVAGELAGHALGRVVFWDTFWFAWSTFAKGTKIIPMP